MPAPAIQVLQAAAQGGVVERPLLAPLCSAIAGELHGLAPEPFLRDVTKLSNSVRDMVRSLNVDVAIAEFGTLWEAEALGLPLDWASGFPPLPRGTISATAAPDYATSGRGPVVLEAIRRLQALLPDRIVAAGVSGPVRLSRLSGGSIAPEAAAMLLLPAVRLLCEAGARLIWVVEDPEPPEQPEAVADALQPLWHSIRFYQGLGVLHLAGAADGWLALLAAGGPYLPCFNPASSPGLASQERSRQSPYGLALPTGPVESEAVELARTGRCALLTNTEELAGQVPARDLRRLVATLRNPGG